MKSRIGLAEKQEGRQLQRVAFHAKAIIKSLRERLPLQGQIS